MVSFQEASGLVKKEELTAQHAAQSEQAKDPKDPKAEKKSAWVEKMKAMMKEKEDEKASNEGKSSIESSNESSNPLHSSSKPSVYSEDAMKERVKEKIRAMKQKSMEVRPSSVLFHP